MSRLIRHSPVNGRGILLGDEIRVDFIIDGENGIAPDALEIQQVLRHYLQCIENSSDLLILGRCPAELSRALRQSLSAHRAIRSIDIGMSLCMFGKPASQHSRWPS